MSHRNRLARRQCRDLRVGHPTGRGIRLEGRSVRGTHGYLTADPGTTGLEGLAGPAVTRLTILEQWQHVRGAHHGPLSQQTVMVIRERAAATDRDQPGVTLFGRIGTLLPTIRLA